ncbi:MAG: type III secretion protein [Desulfovibrionaceae bacterium]|nr:type III secretion protein [Desulfovibrionaceae bacterium]MBR5734774.1 type III secretion protein [Desulfovibrionaceae bacterium]
MPKTIDFLTPSLGIQDVMPMAEAKGLPEAGELAPNTVNAAGLEALFASGNARRLVEEALRPDVGDGAILAPRRFQEALDSLVRDCASSADPAVREMIDKELMPLLHNRALLQAYMGLMIGG